MIGSASGPKPTPAHRAPPEGVGRSDLARLAGRRTVRPMKSGKKCPTKRKKPVASAKPSRSEAARQAVAEDIDEQRKFQRSLIHKLYH